VVILSPIRIVSTSNNSLGINPKLDYQAVDDDKSSGQQLLADIKAAICSDGENWQNKFFACV
jgi:hypothetical protein